jgi:hypothetical protein
VADLDALLRELTNDEAVLLDEIWRFQVENRQWIPAVELHRRAGSRRLVRDILERLGGAIVLHNDWDVQPFYRVWALGAVLSPTGRGGELLLEKWLAYQVHLYRTGDIDRSVGIDEIAAKLDLSDDCQARVLGALVELLPEWWSGGGFGPTAWSFTPARNIDEIADEPDLRARVLRTLTAEYDRWGRTLPIDAREREAAMRRAPGVAQSVFAFITDLRLREVLDSDWAEARTTAAAEAWKRQSSCAAVYSRACSSTCLSVIYRQHNGRTAVCPEHAGTALHSPNGT